jgi:hypothetical protein
LIPNVTSHFRLPKVPKSKTFQRSIQLPPLHSILPPSPSAINPPPMLRSQLRVPRLHRSLHTTRAVRADAPQKAAAQVSNTASKAASSAQEYAGKALEQSQKFAQVIGNTTGKLLSNAGPRVNGLVDRVVGLQKPIVYWGKVTGEVAKQGTYIILVNCQLRCFGG